MDNGFKSQINFLMGGTRDSINIIKFLKEECHLFNITPYILTTTTTDYGRKIAKDAGSDEVIAKPLSKEEMVNILKNNRDQNHSENNNNDNNTQSPKKSLEDSLDDSINNSFNILIDTTHPFAVNATSTAIEAEKLLILNIFDLKDLVLIILNMIMSIQQVPLKK